MTRQRLVQGLAHSRCSMRLERGLFPSSPIIGKNVREEI